MEKDLKECLNKINSRMDALQKEKNLILDEIYKKERANFEKKLVELQNKVFKISYAEKVKYIKISSWEFTDRSCVVFYTTITSDKYRISFQNRRNFLAGSGIPKGINSCKEILPYVLFCEPESILEEVPLEKFNSIQSQLKQIQKLALE